MRLPRYPFARRRKPSSAPLTLGQRNIYVFPNRWGWSFAGLILLFLLVATNYNNNLSFLLAFLLAAMALISAVHGQRNLAGLVLKPGKAGAAFLGEELPFTLLLGDSRQRPRFALQIGFKEGVSQELSLPAGDDAVVLTLRPRQRGRCNPGAVVVESRYPLGLFRVWSRLAFDWNGLVYPAPASTAEPLPFASGGDDPGSNDGGDDFSGFRAYQAGDAPKRVHWKSYAQGRGMLTRVYRHGGQKQLWLDWNAATDDGVEAKLSRLCRWVLDAEHSGQVYGLRLPNREISPDRGLAHQAACLEALALFQR
ncbi:DUF58 domain-containing protein [Methylogaea oryzae]|uniref:DUF58 domain-containing protein n=1 Tax=Methylogaea oryzae TaxID=1295382 RepID=A0A8D5ALJ0_9GAMM|nr:DUF58 domain-containing protein [Methylogaea oryzae]BBL72884.1 hypothetical protein MoryE10_34900 [Methylogaea oryzae]